jgi:hypothetical protein
MSGERGGEDGEWGRWEVRDVVERRHEAEQ